VAPFSSFQIKICSRLWIQRR